MPVQFEKWFRVDLNKKAMTEWIGNGLFTNDNLSNLIGVELYDGLTPIDIPGNVEGILILPNGGTLTINGSHEGNRAWIELPETALSLEGLIVITIKTIINDRKVTLVQCSGRVVATETGMVIDPDDIVPKDVTEFMAMLDDLRDLIDGYSDIIMVQDTQPDSETNKLWLLKTPDTGIQIPTMDDLNGVSSTVSGLVEDVTDIQSDLADAIESIETLETTTEGLSDSVADLEEEVANKADIDGYYTDMTVGAAEQVVSSTMVEDNAPYKLRTSGGSTDIGNRAYVDKIVGGTVAWNQQVRDAASENVTEYADVVTVTDAVEDDAAVSVRVEPVQDLHGYDAPWPAGGGVNKADISTLGHTGPYTDSGATALSTKRLYTTLMPVQQSNYYVSVLGTSSNSEVIMLNRVIIYDSNQQFIQRISVDKNGAVFANKASAFVTIPAGAAYAQIDLRTNALNTDIEPSDVKELIFAIGDTAVPYTPYSNLCPISGWDEVEVTRTGKNLLDFIVRTQNGIVGTKINGVAHIAGTATATAYPVDFIVTKYPAGTYVWSISGLPTGVTCNYTKNGAWAGVVTQGVTFTLAEPAAIGGYVQVANGTTVDNDIRIQLEKSSTASEFEQYQGNTYTITLPQTVYNGNVGSEGGESGSGMLVFDGVNVQGSIVNTGYITETVTRAYYSIPNTNIPVTLYPQRVTKCNCAVYNNAVVDNTQTYSVINSGTRLEVNVRLLNSLTGITTSDTVEEAKAKWNAYASQNPIQVYYETATQTQFLITPSPITTLLGTNHVWSDAGQLALTYTGTDEHLTLTSGRKYLTRINGTDSMVLGTGQDVTAVKGRDNVFDLTQMLGTSVADYVYQQGAGYFRKWFGGTRYAYNTGELISVQGLQSRDAVGFNQWDEEWEVGAISNGVPVAYNNSIRSKNYCECVGGQTYYGKCGSYANDYYMAIWWYDENKDYLSRDWIAGTTATSPAMAKYFKISTNTSTYVYGTTYNHDICINLSHNGTRNGSYEPYTHRSYPLDSTLTMRGVPKVGTNGVYWDGDEYGYDGGVKRRYGVVDLGTLSWTYTSGYFLSSSISGRAKQYNGFVCVKYIEAGNVTMANAPDKSIRGSYTDTPVYVKDSTYTDAASFKTAMSGIYLIYELATPTAETAAPYQHIQSVDDWGTEEFISGTITPVGHRSRYPQNLRDKLQHLPALASSNGSYIITQTNGQMVLSPFPAPPTAAGNYLLKATVSGGNATYSWVAQ